MIASGNQNQFLSSFAPLGDLLKTLMFLLNLNGFNSSPSPPNQGFAKRKGSSKVWREKGSKWFCHFFSLLFLFLFVLLVCFALLFCVNLVLCIALFNFFLFVFFSILDFFSYKNKNKNWKIQKQCMFVYIGTYVPWMAIETKFFKFCISCNLDKYLYAQLNKWVLWLLFVMSKIKLSLVLDTHITLFYRND